MRQKTVGIIVVTTKGQNSTMYFCYRWKGLPQKGKVFEFRFKLELLIENKGKGIFLNLCSNLAI